MILKKYLFGLCLSSSLIFAGEVPFDVAGEVFDYGPQTTKVILKFEKSLDIKSIGKESFKVISQDSQERKVMGIDFIDNKTLVLNLEHGQKVEGAGLLFWDDKAFSNIEIPIQYYVTQTNDLKLENGKVIKVGQETYKMENLKVKGVDKFTFGEKYGLKYRDFKPEKDNKKHPLIIWLHGAGEGGVSNVTQILGNRGGVAFVEEESQNIFDKPFVLAPQTPTFWMQSFMVGDRELIGKKDYTPDLVKLIKNYIQENPEIDSSRVYIGGCSMGGYQTFKTLVYAPDIFAGAFITCPAYEPSEKELDIVKNIPIWLVHASDDTTVPVTNSRNSYNYLKNKGADVVYTEYKDVVRDGNKYDPHGSYFYTLHNDPKTKEGIHIFQWLSSKVKK